MRQIYVKLLLVSILIVVNSSGIEDKVKQYFKTDVFKAFQKHWQAHRKSFENAILLALKENYGHRGMNIYIRRSADSLKLCTGFYSSDNVIDLLLIDMTLTGLPHLTMPEVTFALASNVLRVEAGLSKMIMEAEYRLFRNRSDIVYLAMGQTLEKSPFSYLQVQPYGQLAVVAEDCTLVGFILTKLSGHLINLGHDTFRVKNCKFHVEISSYHPGEPPVIAPYFSVEQSKQLELMLTRPIRDELLPKLQAAVFTYLNTSLIFGDYLAKFREYQNNVFKDTVKYINEMVRRINNETVQANHVTVDLEPSAISWTSTSVCSGESCDGHILVDNVTLYGLDTLYASHTGGPYKLQSPRIAEELRFHTLMVRGSIFFVNNTIQGNHDFVAEIHDVSVEYEIDVEKSEPKIEVLNWRSYEFSIIELEGHQKSRKDLDAFIEGYLRNKLPILLKDHLTSMYNKWHHIGHKVAGAVSNTTIFINVNANDIKS